MGRWGKPEGGDIETYRAYNSPEAQTERETALVVAQIEAQNHAQQAAQAASTVRAVDNENG